MWDSLDFALGLVEEQNDGGKPYLIEVARRFDGGKVDGQVFLWSTGRIGAFVNDGRIKLKRQRGVMTEGQWISLDQLRALNHVVTHWKEHREEWAMWRCAFNGVTAWTIYLPPGPGAKAEELGTHSIMGPRRGQTEFIGEESVRPLPVPIEIGPGVVAHQMIWRSGEKQGPPEGQQVGLVYALPNELTAKAYRDELDLEGGGGRVFIEPGEEDFVKELLATLESIKNRP